MKSRVFWNTVMNEAILAQELDLPATGVSLLEDFVPIPKFINSQAHRLFVKPAHRGDIAFFQYHFLAQVAHRIILTRIRDSLYVFCRSRGSSMSKKCNHVLTKITRDSGIWQFTSSTTQRRNASPNRTMAS